MSKPTCTRAIQKKHLLLLLPVILLLTTTWVRANTGIQEDQELAKLFQERHLTGTIVITDLLSRTTYIHNKNRAHTRFLPASTFKIINTLIALDAKAIKDEKEIIPWDGKDRPFPGWNKDQTLESAFPLSCVWFYQELASRVGNAIYLKHLKTIDYGNKKTGPHLTTFWLNGEIAISPIEQIEFLKKLYKNKLPYSRAHIDILKKIMTVAETPAYTIRAKTGWTMRVDSQIGWYVGYLENKDNVWFFALNIAINNKKDAAFRKALTMEALKLKGLLK